MPVKWGLPSPRISTKVFGILALLLAIIGALAAAAIELARHTERTVSEFQREGYGAVALSGRLQVFLEQHRRLVAAAPVAADNQKELRAYQELNAEIPGLIERLAPRRSQMLLDRFAAIAAQGASVFELAQRQQRDKAIEASVNYGSAADELLLDVLEEAKRRTTSTEKKFQSLTARAQNIAGWVSTAAAAAGLLIGPFCFLLLNRMLGRTREIGSALIRLARNDTSVEISGTSDHDELGQLARSVAVFKAKSIELLAKKADFERLAVQLDAAISNMPLGLSMFDAQERLIMCNKRYAEMYDVPAELARPGTANCALWEHRIRKGARHSQDRPMNVSVTELASTMLIEFSNGRVIEVSRQPIKGGGWVTLHEDITERRRQEDKIRHLARHDALTGLANRMLFRERLEQNLESLERGQGFAVLCLDLDHFKAVNDTLGHPIGDQLLKQVGSRLVSCVREGDIVARLGGDEFAIVQAGVRHQNQTEALAARIVETVGAPFEVEHNRINIGTSIGITLGPGDGTDVDTLMKNADLALYRTKEAGRRGFAFFEPRMGEEAQKRGRLGDDLRWALTQDDLELVYSPVICLVTDRPVAFEANLRWLHPNRGPISSAELFDMAEQAGLMGKLGGWILRHACADAARWSSPLTVAVHLPAQFKTRHLTETVLQALAQSGLPAHRLEVEVAKAALGENRGMPAVLHQLRQLGVRIAVDAFGDGPCSLASLRAFPFDKVKVGRSFTADIGRSKETRAIVEAILALGCNLRMTTLAQGIEDFEQLALLRERGCRQGQGMLLGPPLAASEVDAFLTMRAAAAQAAAHRKALEAPLNPESGETDAPPGSSQAA